MRYVARHRVVIAHQFLFGFTAELIEFLESHGIPWNKETELTEVVTMGDERPKHVAAEVVISAFDGDGFVPVEHGDFVFKVGDSVFIWTADDFKEFFETAMEFEPEEGS